MHSLIKGIRDRTIIAEKEIIDREYRETMKSKLIFLAKCILAALPFLVVIVFTFAYPMAYMDNEYPARKYTREVITGKTDYETLILGDSRAMADLMPEYLGDGCVNLATGGATSVENYYYLQDYLKHHQAPETCLILFAPFHYSYMDNFRTRTVYFNDLSIAQMAEVRKNAHAVGAQAVTEEVDTTDLIANRLRLPNVYLPALLNARFTGRYDDNSKILSNLRESRGYAPFGTAEGSDELNYETSYESLRESGDSQLIGIYMRKLIELCEQNGIRVIVLQAPMNKASFDTLQEGFVKGYALYMQSLSDLYPDITVEREIPCYENALFGDSSHLNETGALQYTEEIAQKYMN